MNRHLAALRVMVQHEKKKAVSLAALLALLLVFVGRAFVSLGPRSGRASPDGGSSVSSLASAGEAAVTRALASEASRHRNRVIEARAHGVTSRNLFALDPAHFPHVSAPSQASQTVAPSLSPSHSGVELKPLIADEPAVDRTAQLVAETGAWRLRSTLTGGEPTAVIEAGSGKGVGGGRHVLRTGESLLGWTVIEIGSSSVVVEKEAVRVRLLLVTQGSSRN